MSPRSILISADGNPSSVAVTTTDQVILTDNMNRKGGVVWNDGASNVFVLLSQNTISSTTVFTVNLASGTYYQIPSNYIGQVRGICGSAGSANVRITELV